jgi:septal ring factor EnvC (AmiA/AmiB activator)
MKFDVTKSKLYSSIMEGLVSFFELEADNATETDIHAKIEGSEPLSKLLEKATEKAVGDLTAKVDGLTSKVTDLEKQVSDLTTRAENAEAQIAQKDNRIEELQIEVANEKKTVQSIKDQHKAETDRLAGKIAAMKAGVEKETDTGAGESEIVLADKAKTGTETVTIASKSLKDLVTRKALN